MNRAEDLFHSSDCPMFWDWRNSGVIAHVSDLIASFKASGIQFDPRAFVDNWRLEADSVWLRGETGILGCAHGASSVSIGLPDTSSRKELCTVLLSFLSASEPWLIELRKLCDKRELNIGIMVGSEHSYAPSVEFPVDLLSIFVRCGVSVRVSGYPCSED